MTYCWSRDEDWNWGMFDARSNKSMRGKYNWNVWFGGTSKQLHCVVVNKLAEDLIYLLPIIASPLMLRIFFVVLKKMFDAVQIIQRSMVPSSNSGCIHIFQKHFYFLLFMIVVVLAKIHVLREHHQYWLMLHTLSSFWIGAYHLVEMVMQVYWQQSSL